jgi:hypothetical protein
MRLIYFWSSDATRSPFPGERNDGIQAVPSLLKRLEALGHEIKSIDTSSLSEKERFEYYSRATSPAVYKHYGIKKIFGTNRRSACWFGAEVPALLVTATDPVGDTFPHRVGNRFVTIEEFLKGILVIPEPHKKGKLKG